MCEPAAPRRAGCHRSAGGSPTCGFPAFRLAREVATLTLLEVAADSAATLRRRFERTPNVEVVVDDMVEEGWTVASACTPYVRGMR
jgi:23S rRNA A2030 N6-methylase RlmJ